MSEHEQEPTPLTLVHSERKETVPPRQVKIAFVMTEGHANIINAAIAHYWLALKLHPESELHALLPQVEDVQRKFVDQVRVRAGSSGLHPNILALYFV